jgi:hypothetical protein
MQPIIYEVERIQNTRCLVITEYRIFVLNIIYENGGRRLRTSLIRERGESLTLEKTDNKRLFD